MVHGRYGEFTVLVDDEPVIDAGILSALGVIPANRKIVAAVQTGSPGDLAESS